MALNAKSSKQRHTYIFTVVSQSIFFRTFLCFFFLSFPHNTIERMNFLSWIARAVNTFTTRKTIEHLSQLYVFLCSVYSGIQHSTSTNDVNKTKNTKIDISCTLCSQEKYSLYFHLIRIFIHSLMIPHKRTIFG